jgi:hypothetical protein
MLRSGDVGLKRPAGAIAFLLPISIFTWKPPIFLEVFHDM